MFDYDFSIIEPMFDAVQLRWAVLKKRDSFAEMDRQEQQRAAFAAIQDAWDFLTNHEAGVVPLDVVFWTVGKLRADGDFFELIELDEPPEE